MRNDERSEELSNRNLKQMEEFYIESNVHKSVIYKIKTRTDYEAQMIFIYKILNETNKNLINEENILSYYYKIKDELIDFIINERNILSCYYKIKDEDILFINLANYNIHDNWKNTIKEMKYSLLKPWYNTDAIRDQFNRIIQYINLKIPNFVDVLKSRNPKFFKECLINEYFNIKTIRNYNNLDYKYKFEITNQNTFISIERILKKVKNTKYWHIWRIFLF